MPPEVSANLSRITKASADVNRLATQATEQIRALDEFLKESGVGVELIGPTIGTGRADRTFNTRDQDEYEKTVNVTHYLGYDRDDGNGEFALVVTTIGPKLSSEGLQETNEYGEPATEVYFIHRLERCARHLRLAAMEVMPEFLDSLAESVEELATESKKHIGRTASTISELKSALKK